MRALRTLKVDLSGYLGTALVAVLFASSGTLYAQKNKTAASTPPAKSAPAPTASHAAAPAASHPASGRGGAPSNTGRPAVGSPAAGRPAVGSPATGRPAVGSPAVGRPAVGSPAAGRPAVGSPTAGRGPVPNNNAGRGQAPSNNAGRGPVPNNNAGRSFGTNNNAGRGPVPNNNAGRSFGTNNNAGRGPVPNNSAGRPAPRSDFHGASNSSVHYGHTGQPTVVHTAHGATIVHTPGGGRTMVMTRPGGRVIVTNGAGHGYMQRSVNVHGHEFVQRTYYVHGNAYPRYYRPYSYRGMAFNVYTPVRFYSPRFYSWGYTPWARPVYYNFGWAANPWYGYYGGYFTPYPSYAAPNYWLTDYLLANSLQEAYQERMDAAAAAQAGYDPSGQVALSPRVKNLVAAEVQRQLSQESADSQNAGQAMLASNGAPPILADNNPHVFVVASSLIANTGGQECALTHGDVLQLNPAPSSDPTFANVQVLASKGQDCQAGNLVPVQLTDLQEMQNHMRETMDQGLGELQTRQGQGGLPTIEVGMRSQTAASYAADLPPAETNVAAELKQQAQEADQQEQAVLGQAGQNAPPPSSGRPFTLQLGQSIEEVVANMGPAVRVADVGQKKIYFYKDMKVTFVNGRVSDVQ
jgi:hypothetical protein